MDDDLEYTEVAVSMSCYVRVVALLNEGRPHQTLYTSETGKTIRVKAWCGITRLSAPQLETCG